mmetsp:Transcript_40126/g.65131  ORF Transcript_40126/g.65131 Transcript_40126/m.65131 type:complete len:289 (+) Transcript_40126:1376-2242(+)
MLFTNLRIRGRVVHDLEALNRAPVHRTGLQFQSPKHVERLLFGQTVRSINFLQQFAGVPFALHPIHICNQSAVLASVHHDTDQRPFVIETAGTIPATAKPAIIAVPIRVSCPIPPIEVPAPILAPIRFVIPIRIVPLVIVLVLVLFLPLIIARLLRLRKLRPPPALPVPSPKPETEHWQLRREPLRGLLSFLLLLLVVTVLRHRLDPLGPIHSVVHLQHFVREPDLTEALIPPLHCIHPLHFERGSTFTRHNFHLRKVAEPHFLVHLQLDVALGILLVFLLEHVGLLL